MMVLGLITLILVPIAFGMVFYFAPLEQTMGIVQKIFYFHVAYAAMMMFGLIICGLASLFYLIYLRNNRLSNIFDAIAVSAADIAVMGGAVVLITGPIWAHEAWGVYWTWEPRLTLVLVTFFILLAYKSLRSFSDQENTGKTASAGLAVLSLPAAYYIHIAAAKWGGAHPRVVFTGGLPPGGIKETFFVSLAAGIVLGIFLGLLRYYVARLEQDTDTLFLHQAINKRGEQ